MEGGGIKEPAPSSAEEIGCVLTGRVPSSLDTETGRGANWIGGVSVRKLHSGLREAVDIRGFVKTF